jgi:hypothetical protein
MVDADTVGQEVKAQAAYSYWARLLRAADMFGNVLVGGALDDTISSRVARWRDRTGGWVPCVCCKVFNVLFREADHCQEALLADTARAQLEIARDAVDLK